MKTETRREFHIIGPPGTGKTRFLAHKTTELTDRFGSNRILIASLTKAAAVEIGSRVKIPKEQAGTLHSICLHGAGLQGKAVLDSPKGIALWNDWIKHKKGQEWLTLKGGTDPDDPGGSGAEASPAQGYLERMTLLRHQLTHEDKWPDAVRNFAILWIQAMDDLDATDFTSMIEAGAKMEHAPGNPKGILLDEYQDFSKLEGLVVRKWANAAEFCMMAGDEDQVLYSWRGSDPRIFSDHPVAPERFKVLGQSYRVPQKVHALARQIITRVPGRMDAPYLPTEEPGEVAVNDAARWKAPEDWIDSVLRDSQSGTAMVLASCSYMLQPLMNFLRHEGIPFHNPFRRRRGDWNPLGTQGDEGRNKTAARQLSAFFAGTGEGWSTEELQTWIPLLRSCRHKIPLMDDTAPLRYGAKTALGRLSEPFPTPGEYLGLWSEPEDALRAKAREIDWLSSGMDTKGRERMRFPMRVYEKLGVAGLKAEPSIIVGTIHSVKGGEADSVYVLTALPQRWQEEGGDELTRLFYVAVTRARRKVTILCGDRGGYAI